LVAISASSLLHIDRENEKLLYPLGTILNDYECTIDNRVGIFTLDRK
jgi:hypothetical protein